MAATQPAKDSNGKYTAYAWPGGYPVYHLTEDGGVLCPACANDPDNPVHETPQGDPQWQIVASDINWEDTDLTCDAALAADDAYQAALVRTYGNRAIEARYDYKRNGATAELATLADAKHEADAAWMDHLQEARRARLARDGRS